MAKLINQLIDLSNSYLEVHSPNAHSSWACVRSMRGPEKSIQSIPVLESLLAVLVYIGRKLDLGPEMGLKQATVPWDVNISQQHLHHHNQTFTLSSRYFYHMLYIPNSLKNLKHIHHAIITENDHPHKRNNCKNRRGRKNLATTTPIYNKGKTMGKPFIAHIAIQNLTVLK